MKKQIVWISGILTLSTLLFGTTSRSDVHAGLHLTQHGFILAADDKFASHLVAPGHHSRQVDVMGELTINDELEQAEYQMRKVISAGQSYFVFQAQNLDLPTLQEGQILVGHIIESKVGGYDPKNIVVKEGTLKVNKIILNLINPFF